MVLHFQPSTGSYPQLQGDAQEAGQERRHRIYGQCYLRHHLQLSSCDQDREADLPRAHQLPQDSAAGGGQGWGHGTDGEGAQDKDHGKWDAGLIFHFLQHNFIPFPLYQGSDVFCPLEILPGTPGEREKIDVER